MKKLILSLLALPLMWVSSYGALWTYDVGLSLVAGSGSGSGTITIDSTVAGSDPDFFGDPPATAGWTDMSLTFTGTTNGLSDGTFTLDDLTGVAFEKSLEVSSIDYSSDLVPQFNDINLFDADRDAVDGVEPFAFRTIASSDEFQITSMAPIPEPSILAYLLVVVGLVATRRRLDR